MARKKGKEPHVFVMSKRRQGAMGRHYRYCRYCTVFLVGRGARASARCLKRRQGDG